ncbi:hypothetical protein PENTCL1PPCAC_24252, partial [Pristionchus entomophagus]
NSNFVLKWEIDNAAATLATGKAESGVFNEGGFKWTAVVERRADAPFCDKAEFSLRCDVDHNLPWTCEVDAQIFVLRRDGRWIAFTSKNHFCFADVNSVWANKLQPWTTFT